MDRVVGEANQRPYVEISRNVSRERLEDLLGTHRYGLNLKPDEHFGISVAEYVAAGMIAFAPDGGGQRDIFDGRSDRLFDSMSAPSTASRRVSRARITRRSRETDSKQQSTTP